MIKFPGMVLRRQNKSLNFFLEKVNKLYRTMSQRRCCCRWNSDDLKLTSCYLVWLLPFTDSNSCISITSGSFRWKEIGMFYIIVQDKVVHTIIFYDFLTSNNAGTGSPNLKETIKETYKQKNEKQKTTKNKQKSQKAN